MPGAQILGYTTTNFIPLLTLPVADAASWERAFESFFRLNALYVSRYGAYQHHGPQVATHKQHVSNTLGTPRSLRTHSRKSVYSVYRVNVPGH